MSPVTSFNSGRKFSNPKNWSFYRALIWIFEKRAAIGSDDYGIEPTTIRNMHVSLRNGCRFIRPLLNLVDFPDIVPVSLSTRHGQNQQRPVVKKLQRPFFLKKPLFYNGSRKRIKIIFLIDGTYVKFQGDHFGAKNVHF